MVALAPEQINMFERDGFVIVEGFLNRDEVRCAKAGIEPLFQGQFETGIRSDEWNWRAECDTEDLSRQICNGWKSDRTVAVIVTKAEIGKSLLQNDLMFFKPLRDSVSCA